MNLILLSSIILVALPSCSRRPPVPKATSSGWRADQISLTGEWYPAVALIGAAESLDDYLGRTDFNSPTLTLYLDNTLEEQILPEHRPAYDAVLDAIFARASKICLARGIIAKRGTGGGGSVQPGPGAEPHLVLRTHFRSETAVIGITISNMAREPYCWVTYAKAFRGITKYLKEDPFPPMLQK